MIQVRSYILIVIAALLEASCTRPQQKDLKTIDKGWDIDSGLNMDVGDVQTVLPQERYAELVEINCVPCHSLRYIEMQPDLSYKAWEKTVDKMIRMYGAPVRDSATRLNIIKYLYAIKGKKEH